MRSQRGSLTIELMVAAVLALVVSIGMSTVALTLNRFYREGAERIRMQQEVERASNWVTLAVRRASTWTIFDPADPGTPLLEGPAIRLLDGAGATIEKFQLSQDGKSIRDAADHSLSDLTVSDLWFRTGPDGDLQVTVALIDRKGNQTEIESGATPRN